MSASVAAAMVTAGTMIDQGWRVQARSIVPTLRVPICLSVPCAVVVQMGHEETRCGGGAHKHCDDGREHEGDPKSRSNLQAVLAGARGKGDL